MRMALAGLDPAVADSIARRARGVIDAGEAASPEEYGKALRILRALDQPPANCQAPAPSGLGGGGQHIKIRCQLPVRHSGPHAATVEFSGSRFLELPEDYRLERAPGR